MPADPTKVRDPAYFERHKHRVASGLNSIGQELWEANDFGKRSETATPENDEEVEEGS